MADGVRPLLVILAGGKSTRLWPLEEKSLIEFTGQPLFLQQLRRFAGLGFRDVALITSPDNRDAMTALAAQVPDLSMETFVQSEARGMGDALLLLRDLVTRLNNRPIYINQVHDIFDLALHEAILSAYETDQADALLAAYRVASYFPGGYLRLGDGGRIAGIVEKPGPGNEPSDLVTLVAHLHRDPQSLLDAIANEYHSGLNTDDHYERAMAALMQQKIFMPVPYQGQWKAIKYPWHVLDAMEYFLGQIQGQTIAANVRIADNAVVSGPVIIEPNVRMFAGSCVVGPAYIGAGAIIGNNALVRDSMIGRKSVVGYSTEVARSYVGSDVWFHTNYIGDSVIDCNVSFGSGGITANLRLDEQNIKSTVKGQRIDTGRAKLGAIVGSGARMGVNALLMPGVKVGSGSFVGPGVVMHDDAPDHTQVLVKQELDVRPMRGTVLAGDRERFRSRL